jgi:Transposase DDE domain
MHPTAGAHSLCMEMVRDDEAAAERQRRYQTWVAELAAAARARGQQPRARIKPRRQDEAPELLVWPSRTGRTGKPRRDGKPSASKSHGLRAAMFAKLASEQGKACYTLRKQTVEPVFGQLKEHQGARRFTRRGLGACEAAWKLL